MGAEESKIPRTGKREIQAVDDVVVSGLNFLGQEDELHTQAGILYYIPEAVSLFLENSVSL